MRINAGCPISSMCSLVPYVASQPLPLMSERFSWRWPTLTRICTSAPLQIIKSSTSHTAQSAHRHRTHQLTHRLHISSLIQIYKTRQDGMSRLSCSLVGAQISPPATRTRQKETRPTICSSCKSAISNRTSLADNSRIGFGSRSPQPNTTGRGQEAQAEG